jgi:hypothetical protein
MTDKAMIEALRNYARAYTSDKAYGFNPGLALMIANRMEQLITNTEKEKVEYDRQD